MTNFLFLLYFSTRMEKTFIQIVLIFVSIIIGGVEHLLMMLLLHFFQLWLILPFTLIQSFRQCAVKKKLKCKQGANRTFIDTFPTPSKSKAHFLNVLHTLFAILKIKSRRGTFCVRPRKHYQLKKNPINPFMEV